MPKNMCPFTSSMRLLRDNDTENFYIIEGNTVIFDAWHVNTTSIMQTGKNEISVRLNLRDGTHLDTIFEVERGRIVNKPTKQATQNEVSFIHT